MESVWKKLSIREISMLKKISFFNNIYIYVFCRVCLKSAEFMNLKHTAFFISPSRRVEDLRVIVIGPNWAPNTIQPLTENTR